MILRARLNILLDSALCTHNCSAQSIATGYGNMALSRGHVHDIRPSWPHASAFEEELDELSQACTDYDRATIDQFSDSLRQAAHAADFYQASGSHPAGLRWYPNRVAEHAAVFTELRSSGWCVEILRTAGCAPSHLVSKTIWYADCKPRSPSSTYLVHSLHSESKSRIACTQAMGGREYL